jgi:hypothetical protein
MTRDSSTGKESDPLSLNVYIYAEDNPMNFTDPTGHYAENGFSQDGEIVTIRASSNGKKTIVTVVVGGVVTSENVLVVPAWTNHGSLSTPAEQPNNIPPQMSTNTASSPPQKDLYSGHTQGYTDIYDTTAVGNPSQGETTSEMYTSASPNSGSSGLLSTNQVETIAVNAGVWGVAVGAVGVAGAQLGLDPFSDVAAGVAVLFAGDVTAFTVANWNQVTPGDASQEYVNAIVHNAADIWGDFF